MEINLGLVILGLITIVALLVLYKSVEAQKISAPAESLDKLSDSIKDVTAKTLDQVLITLKEITAKTPTTFDDSAVAVMEPALRALVDRILAEKGVVVVPPEQTPVKVETTITPANQNG